MKYQSALLLTTLLMPLLFFVQGCTFPDADSFADDPFGFDVTVSPTEYDYCSSDGKGFYTCTSAPKPHPEFESYALLFVDPGVSSPHRGICKLIATGKRIEADYYGQITTEKLEDIKEQLKKKYGNPSQEFNRLMPGAVAQGAQYWMREIYQKKRVYEYFWFRNPKVGSVSALSLVAKAVSDSDAIVILGFEYNYLNGCPKN